MLRPILWRLHFIGGLLAGPVVVSLAITGIAFAWNPQIDGLRFGDLVKPSSKQVNVSLADHVRAAQAVYPDWVCIPSPRGTRCPAATISTRRS
jgi:uncharacterized iron-regulated membrane protein